jgi:hypothetical protein
LSIARTARIAGKARFKLDSLAVIGDVFLGFFATAAKTKELDNYGCVDKG